MNKEKNKYQIKMDLFEGPLDLLWSLISKSKLDILQISLSEITNDFLHHISLLKIMDIEVAADFILMASRLLHYKSKMLLPMENELVDEESLSLPPELVQQLLEYKKYQKAANNLFSIKEEAGDVFTRNNEQAILNFPADDNWKEVDMLDLLAAFSRIAENFEEKTTREIKIEEVSVEECIQKIRNIFKSKANFLFMEVFSHRPNKVELVANFLAILELVRLKEICIMQHRIFGDIRIFTQGK